jgi:hypothetical protein
MTCEQTHEVNGHTFSEWMAMVQDDLDVNAGISPDEVRAVTWPWAEAFATGKAPGEAALEFTMKFYE